MWTLRSILSSVDQQDNICQCNGLFKQSKSSYMLCSLAVQEAQEAEIKWTTAYIILQQSVMSMILGFVIGYLSLTALEEE